MKDILAYYAAPGTITQPGDYAKLLDDLPTDIGQLCQMVQGALIHVFWAERYGLQLSDQRRAEVQLRTVVRQLARIHELDARPLTVARPLTSRLVGNCRDFSVLLTTILRHQGVPARARCGFARYFLPNHYEDHWVCEYWNTARKRWVLVDAQLDFFQSAQLAIPFDPLDVPRDQFIVGGRAWQLCRTGAADPETFGIFDMQGLWFVRGDLVRDIAALNKIELLPWDGWGIIEARDDELTADDLALLDRMAALSSGDVPEFEQVRALYEREERLRVPATIRSYTAQGVQEVDVLPC